jgi:hypothetical protein
MRDSLLMALYGASAVVCVTIGLVFLRYWKAQRDRLFGFFAGAFGCFAAGWVYIREQRHADEAAHRSITCNFPYASCVDEPVAYPTTNIWIL